MIFCDDSDLMRVQPYVFEQGVASFEELHEVAGDEVVRDCRMYWLSVVPVVAPDAASSRDDGFEASRLNPLQWVSAAIYRVLGVACVAAAGFFGGWGGVCGDDEFLPVGVCAGVWGCGAGWVGV